MASPNFELSTDAVVPAPRVLVPLPVNRVVFAAACPPSTPHPLSSPALMARAAIHAEDQRRAAAAAGALREHAARLHLPAKVITLPGDPRSVVADFVDAARADLLVVGSRGLSGMRKLLLGSVSSYLVSHVGCSVVVYRQAKEEGA